MLFAMSTPMPVLWNTSLILTVPTIQFVPLWSAPLPAIPYLTEQYVYYPMIPAPPMGVLTYFYVVEMGLTAFDFGWVEFGGPS